MIKPCLIPQRTSRCSFAAPAWMPAVKLLYIRLIQALGNRRGQATVESALVWLILGAVMLGFFSLQKRLGDGLFIEHALRSASHVLGPNTAGSIGDVFIY